MSTNIPSNLRYTKDHEWVDRDENDDHVAVFGITDHAQAALGDIVHIELPSVGDEYDVGDEIGIIESAKSASEIYAPLKGKVIKVNHELDSHPEMVNESPYENGWIVKIRISDADELDSLLSSDGYQHFLDEGN